MVISMEVVASTFFKSLSEDIRLFSVLLLKEHHELCVCELEFVLEQSQPKISRHLSQLRTSGILTDERRGQWVYYALNPSLPEWVIHVLSAAASADPPRLEAYSERLKQMPNRPSCC